MKERPNNVVPPLSFLSLQAIDDNQKIHSFFEQKQARDGVLMTYLQQRNLEEQEQEEEEQKQKQKPSFGVRIARDPEMWIKKELDVDGYFLLQLADNEKHTNMFLTAEDAFSLTIRRK